MAAPGCGIFLLSFRRRAIRRPQGGSGGAYTLRWARTRDAVEKAANDVIDAQVATHATVEDIARFLGVGMDGMDENHRKTHAKRDAIGGGKVSS